MNLAWCPLLALVCADCTSAPWAPTQGTVTAWAGMRSRDAERRVLVVSDREGRYQFHIDTDAHGIYELQDVPADAMVSRVEVHDTELDCFSGAGRAGGRAGLARVSIETIIDVHPASADFTRRVNRPEPGGSRRRCLLKPDT
ncbi:MAG: hypothetical protein ABIO70_19180 [Pseudomonadota bacterium]